MIIMKFLLAMAGLVLICGFAAGLSACANTGRAPGKAQLERFRQSPQWRGDRFGNHLPERKPPLWAVARRFFLEASEYSDPREDIPLNAPDGKGFTTPPGSGLRVTWLGHSTSLVEIDGIRVLIDPVWGNRASPFGWVGAKRFHAPLLSLEDLPPIDAVVISHDHYDHLDRHTVKQLLQLQSNRWIVPLGVGSHLEYWGASRDDIVELDWWQSTRIRQVRFTATPSRHFSGRSIFFTDTKATLWSGWAINGPDHAVFYSGDTSMHNDFEKIGATLGPFDLSIIEAGAYDPLWADSHLGPEQAVIVHGQVKAKALLPVHWGLFNLAAHGWTEPVERVLIAAEKADARVFTPAPGDSFEPSLPDTTVRWWPDLPWESAMETPIWSSAVESPWKAGRDATRRIEAEIYKMRRE